MIKFRYPLKAREVENREIKPALLRKARQTADFRDTCPQNNLNTQALTGLIFVINSGSFEVKHSPMVFGRLFGWGKNRERDPGIAFGRYSDNNKTPDKVEQWTTADNLFKSKEYMKSLDAFFDYLKDEAEQNVVFERVDDSGTFTVFQGSKRVKGVFHNGRMSAQVSLAKMPETNVPAMRRLLEMNFNLFYTRYCIQDGEVLMKFDTDISSANPNKLYYGLKELATKADKQDDILVNEFLSLRSVDSDHIEPLSDSEKEVKYEYLVKWITETLDYVGSLDNEKFSGAISYVLLALCFRIDFLIVPEGKVLHDLEKIGTTYFGKNEKSAHEKIPAMIEGFEKIRKITRDEMLAGLYRSKHTFAIVPPHNHKEVADSMENAIQNMKWYRDNHYPEIANRVMEYGLAYCQYSYSLPRPLSEFFRLFMQVNYSDYFRALGFPTMLYDPATRAFDQDQVVDAITETISLWRGKYPSLSFKTKNLKFNSLLDFNYTYLSELAALKFE